MDTFSVSDLAKVSGTADSTIRDWLKADILRPSIRPQSGRGRDVLFDFRDAAIAGIVGSLRRAGMGLEVLKQVSTELYRVNWEIAERFLVVGYGRVFFADDSLPFIKKAKQGEVLFTVMDFKRALDNFRKLVGAMSNTGVMSAKPAKVKV